MVERLTLGEKVESPEAVDLPLDLAVALLEDSNGVIDLGLPVSGDLDSPEFSYGALIWKAFTNLLTKIVTSPFRALGALLPGGGEDGFDAVAFEPGRPELPPPEKEKLAQLAGALQKRPQLTLSVQGRYNPEVDRAELQAIAVRRALAARLGRAPEAADDPVDYSGPETAKAVEALFVQRLGAENAEGAQDRAGGGSRQGPQGGCRGPGGRLGAAPGRGRPRPVHERPDRSDRAGGTGGRRGVITAGGRARGGRGGRGARRGHDRARTPADLAIGGHGEGRWPGDRSAQPGSEMRRGGLVFGVECLVFGGTRRSASIVAAGKPLPQGKCRLA